jgi:hypothetical protein
LIREIRVEILAADRYNEIDYRGALRELHSAAFDRTIRSLLRGPRQRRDEIDDRRCSLPRTVTRPPS